MNSVIGRLSLLELEVPEKWIGKTLQDLGMRARYGVTVVAVRTGSEGGRRLMPSPTPTDALGRGDELMVVGPKENVDRLLQELN